MLNSYSYNSPVYFLIKGKEKKTKILNKGVISLKNYGKVLASGLALTLLFSQGLHTVDAKGKHKEKSTHSDDKNKNGISDKWEKKYNLKGKRLAQQDSDKDGLSNLMEYKLKMNPLKADTNNDGVDDGQEDADQDGLSNVSEIQLGTNPEDSDTNNDGVEDGFAKGKDGVQLSDTVKGFHLELKTTDNKEIKVEYKYNQNGKMKIKIEDETQTLTKDMINSLVNELQDTTNLTSDEIVAKIQTVLNVSDSSTVQFDLEYFNGHDINEETDNHVEDPKDEHQTEDQKDQEDGNKDQQQVDNQDQQQTDNQED